MTIRLSLFVAFTLGCAFTSRAQDLVRVPAATYEVSDQITTLKVQVSVSEFLLGAAEVTQKEYEAITSSDPSVYKGADRPVENVSWWDAIRYCNLRSAKEGLTACYDLTSGERDSACTGYRLPTEAEWIVAAGPLPSDRELLDVANLGVSSTKSLDVFEPAIKKGTAHVRSLKASESGFFDLRGNVWEWTGDYFDPVASPDAVRDPSGPPSGLARVIRGGSFVSTTSRWSRDFRSSMTPDWHSQFTGFRVARSSREQKRLTPSNEYLPAIASPTTTLVTSGIERMVPEGIVTKDGVTHEFDVIILATGFRVTDNTFPELVIGRDGRTLRQTWDDGGMGAYNGTTFAGFPNFFMLAGPNTGIGHTSLVYMIEAQFPYILDALRLMKDHGIASVDVRPDVQTAYNEMLQRKLSPTVWNTGGCKSWYLDKNGHNSTIWPDYTFKFAKRLERFDLESYYQELVPTTERKLAAIS